MTEPMDQAKRHNSISRICTIDRKCPAETANHHLGFPVEPIVLQLTKGSRLSRRALCCPPDRDAAEAPGTVTVPDFRLYLRFRC